MEHECMNKINQYCQMHKFILCYADVKVTGPPHEPEFTVVVKIDDVEYGTGTGKNKKEAKAVAARKTWEMIEKQQESPSNMQTAVLATSPVALSPVTGKDYVSLLNTYSQRTLTLVDYPKQKRSGDAHAPMFSCSCTVNGTVYGIGTGPSLAAAKQAAAKQAYEKLDKEGSLRTGSEKSNSNSTFSEYSNSSQVPIQSDSESICFEDPAEKLVGKMKEMSICEKPSPSRKDAQSSALKTKRKLAANFNNARNKEENKKMSDSDESLPDLDTDAREKNESPYTVNGRFLESFKNIEPIGEGAFGNVFKATAKHVEKTYAVKRVCITKNVNREIIELARLDHENIVRYYFSWEGYDHVTYPDSRKKSDKKMNCLFIKMEFCEQGTLENWIEKNRQNRKYHEMAQTKFLQVLEGVRYIHSKELIHRDLKPQNIFISHDDKIKIGDFGLVTSPAYGTLSKNKGTESYMAPEQFGDKYGKEVDIYALGLIWFEMLSPCSRHEKSEKIRIMNRRVFSLTQSHVHCTVEQEQSFCQAKTLAAFQNENKSDLEYVALIENDVTLAFLEKIWHCIREGKFPEDFNNRFPAEAPIIKKMLSRDPSGRLSATEILHLMSVDENNSSKTPFKSLSDSVYKTRV